MYVTFWIWTDFGSCRTGLVELIQSQIGRISGPRPNNQIHQEKGRWIIFNQYLAR